MDGVLDFFLDPANWTGTTGIPNRLFEHLVICALAVFIAALIAIPTGLYIGHTNRASGVAINFANVGRAIPSYAMMVIPLPLTLAARTGPRLRPDPRTCVPADPAGHDLPGHPAAPDGDVFGAPLGRRRARRGGRAAWD